MHIRFADLIRHYLSFVILLLLSLGLISCAEQEAPVTDGTKPETIDAVAIENITLIDALNGVRENQTVIFSGDEIIAVQSASVAHNASDVIDGSGRYLIPGLWDFHVHLTYEEALVDAMADLFLSYGITSVRDTGGLLDKVLPVVEAMNAPDTLAPRVYYAGPLLDGDFVVYNGIGRPEIGTSVPTDEAARQTVSMLADAGVSFIKIYEMVSPEVFAVLVAAAEELGLPIDSHVPLSMRASVAGPDVDAIEHLRNIEMDCAADAEALHARRLELLENPEGITGADLRASLHSLQRLPAVANYDEAQCDQTIAAMSDTVMVPTLRLNSFNLVPAWERNDFEDALIRLPAEVRETWRSQAMNRSQQPPGDSTFAEWSLFLTGRMHEAGVPIGAGTDTPINLSVPGYSLHSELDMLVRAGLTPLEAIETATLEPAKFFDLQDSMGSIDVGKVADLVMLGANPLDNISATKAIELVVSQGRVIR
ncbi:MAG: amidohydrolase family protein [Pseudomonadales bacterium]|nr:amidohydrolase family protein [Pseudomonadales bacterium]